MYCSVQFNNKTVTLSENILRTTFGPNMESDSYKRPFLCILQDCVFDKRKDGTALHVVYQGNIYLNCNNCCKRWFITFNGADCRGPLPIDVAWYMASNSQESHKPGAIEGYCDNIHKGKVRVGINIGNCPGFGNSNGYTGWNSVSRLIIEEVPRSQ